MATTTSSTAIPASAAAEHLREALKSLEFAAQTRASVRPGLAAVRLRSADDHLLLRATDGSFHLSYRLKLSAPGDLDVALNLAQLKKALGAFDKDDLLELAPIDGGIEISRAKRKLTLRAVKTDGVPDWPQTKNRRSAGRVADPAALADCFARALVCAGRDDARPILNSAFVDFEARAVITTDSYRLARVSMPELSFPARAKAPTEALLISYGAAKAIAKDLGRRKDEISLSLYGDSKEAIGGLVVEQGPVTIVCPLKQGQFPEWREILNVKSAASLEFDVEELADALKAVAAVATSAAGDTEPVALVLGDEVAVDFRARDDAELHEVLGGAEFTGATMKIAFAPPLLAESLKIFAGQERLRAALRTPTAPMRLDGGGASALVMPIRLSKVEASAAAAKNGKPS